MLPAPLARLVRQQLGLITSAQCQRAGLSRGFIRHRVASRRWTLVHPGVLATFTGTLSFQQCLMAATLWAGEEASVTGAAACRQWGLKYVPRTHTIDVLVPHEPGIRKVTRGVQVCRTFRRWRPVNLEGVPVTPVALSVVEAARRSSSLREVRALMADAVQRGLTTPEQLDAELARAPTAGTRLPRLALDDLRAGCRSAPEAELRELFAASTILPEPEWNAPLEIPGFGVVRPDALWRRVRLAGEVDSVAHHAGFLDWERTVARHVAEEAAGLLVVHVTPQLLRAEPGWTLRRFEQAYLDRLAA